MLRRQPQNDYQPVARSGSPRLSKTGHSLVNVWPVKPDGGSGKGPRPLEPQEPTAKPSSTSDQNNFSATFLKHGHAFSYAALFLFTLILYARPAEFYPSRLTVSIALLVGIATLGFFIPTQLSLEGTLTARPREVNLVLLFCLTGLLSIPFAINPQEAWAEFSGTFIRCIVIFIVMINVVRTEARLKGLLFLAMVAGIWLSVEAINDYRLGLMTIEGYRAAGRGTGIFGNTNDMALYLVTVLPISVALLFGSKGLARKLLYRVIANCLVVQNQLIREGVSPAKIIQHYNGLDIERLKVRAGLRREEALAAFRLPSERRYLSIVANLRNPVKDHPMFLRAAARVRASVPDVGFVIAGEGELMESLRELAVQLGIKDDVFFIGRCDRVADLLFASDIGVLRRSPVPAAAPWIFHASKPTRELRPSSASDIRSPQSERLSRK